MPHWESQSGITLSISGVRRIMLDRFYFSPSLSIPIPIWHDRYPGCLWHRSPHLEIHLRSNTLHYSQKQSLQLQWASWEMLLLVVRELKSPEVLGVNPFSSSAELTLGTSTSFQQLWNLIWCFLKDTGQWVNQASFRPFPDNPLSSGVAFL